LLGTAEEDWASLYFSVSVWEILFELSEGLSVDLGFTGSSLCFDSVCEVRDDFPPVIRLFYIISITLKFCPVWPGKKSTPELVD
jgi:hypothetical protein